MNIFTTHLYLSIQSYVRLEYDTQVIHHFFPLANLTGSHLYVPGAGSSVGAVQGACTNTHTYTHTFKREKCTRQRVSRRPEILPVSGLPPEAL